MRDLVQWVKELIKNCNIVLKQYKHVVGILYNGQSIRVFLDNIEAESTAPTLQDKSYYLTLFTKNTIDKQQIYSIDSQEIFIEDSSFFADYCIRGRNRKS